MISHNAGLTSLVSYKGCQCVNSSYNTKILKKLVVTHNRKIP